MRKLVRSKIPELMVVEAGRFRPPTSQELGDLLRQKLFEEVGEYFENHDPFELVDVIEVCVGLALSVGWSEEEVWRVAGEKLARRGDLRPGVVWVVGE